MIEIVAVALALRASAPPTPQRVEARTMLVLNEWITTTGVKHAKVVSVKCRNDRGGTFVCSVHMSPPWAKTIFLYRVQVKGGVFRWAAMT